jgi:seryl-tRNA synthetase
MHDLNFFRNNLEAIREKLAARGFDLDIASFQELDLARRTALTESEQLKAQRNAASQEISKLKREGVDTTARQAEVRSLGEKISGFDEQAAKLEQQFRDMLARIPNIPHDSVPPGTDADSNVEVKRWGTPPVFDFEPKPHWDLGVALGILDLERAAKVTGARFAVYWGAGARLERALINFMLDVHTREHGYREVLPPFLINSASLFGTGQLPKFEEDLFRVRDHDFWLAPTAEVPVTNLFRDETLSLEQLPISLCAYTPCFRSEAGSHGRDVRGIIRQHQFQKVELVKFSTPEHSYGELEKLTLDAENILQRLELPYRRMALCAGDMGFGAAKTYDLEVWLPSQNSYKEISSCTNYEAFQARRAQIKAKSGKAKPEFVHTLNGSGLAIGRTWLAIIENFQQKDGSVAIPKALQPYTGTDRIAPGDGWS